MLVFRTIVDQQEQPARRQTFHQAVQHRLGLRIDPVQILEYQDQRLHLALAKQQPFDGVESPLTALGRIECLPRWVIDRHI